MRLYIIRHGETPWNTEMRLQGQTNIPLNENGRALAKATAKGMQDISFDLAITSPLDRAVETAQIVLGDRDISLLRDERIQEITFGEMEGVRFRRDADEASNPEFYCFFHATDRYVPKKGGETFESLYRRTGEFLEELKTKKEWYGKNILVSTHGAASRALLANVLQAPVKEFWGPGVPKNCAVTIVELEKNTLTDSEHQDKKDESGLMWKLKELDKLYYENI